MKPTIKWIIFLVMALAVPTQGQQTEGILNRLLAPGPLMQGHHDLEGSDCLKCHEAGKGISEDKCMVCHKDIKTQVAGKKGFHGLAAGTCLSCHSDHKGRDYDSTKVDQKTFDHGKTGYRLEGKHAELKCSECHKDKRVKMATRNGEIHYIGAKTSCVSCHKKDDPHHFTGKYAKVDCNKCHGLKTWKENLTFNHSKDANFALDGKHAQVKCQDCHKNGKYQWLNLKQMPCLSCHLDFHKQNLSSKFQGDKCQSCHSVQKWEIQKFDHKITGYTLRGKHADSQCVDCHKQLKAIPKLELKKYKWSGLKADCLSCHKDFHRFAGYKNKKFGTLNQCLTCHTESRWKDIHNFNHSVDTRFAIEGKHVSLNCEECHIPGTIKKNGGLVVPPRVGGAYYWETLSKKTCEVCHNNPHNKNDSSEQFKKKKCSECHIAEGWHVFNRNGKRFDHDNTRFKLTGNHSKLKCSACHVVGKKEVFKFEHFEQKFCIDCHKNQHTDQFHQAIETKTCYECHNTEKFESLLLFDHTKTAFALLGKHKDVKCDDCHKSTNEVFESKDRKPHHKHRFIFEGFSKSNCVLCHTDYHRGQLGTSCASCHNEAGWKDVKFDHNRQSKFKITGKHEAVKCEKCHKATSDVVKFSGKSYPVVKYKPIPAECSSCHKDVHQGHYGQNCMECHMDKGWKLTRDFHKSYSLMGVHMTLQCQECHRDNRKLAGESQDCYFCHQKDDVHLGTMPACSKCHKQQMWENISFRHSLTQFPLIGAHRTLECSDCHSRGIYQGLPNQCYNCHLAQARTSVVHPQATAAMNCTQCHNQFTW